MKLYYKVKFTIIDAQLFFVHPEEYAIYIYVMCAYIHTTSYIYMLTHACMCVCTHTHTHTHTQHIYTYVHINF
jgi:hypothetical protein